MSNADLIAEIDAATAPDGPAPDKMVLWHFVRRARDALEAADKQIAELAAFKACEESLYDIVKERDKLRAALEAAERAQRIPREPTEAMLLAGRNRSGALTGIFDGKLLSIWRAMYDAAMRSDKP